MRRQKKKLLAAKGWKVGSVKEFLRLSDEESAYIELKIRLAAGLRRRRQEKGLSQLDLAAKPQSGQSRVAKMEAGDPSVSLDLLIRSRWNWLEIKFEFGSTNQQHSCLGIFLAKHICVCAVVFCNVWCVFNFLVRNHPNLSDV